MIPMEEEPQPEAEPQQVRLRKSNRWWVALFAVLGVALIVRFGVQYRMGSVDRGDRIVAEVVGLAEQAKAANAGKDMDAARRSLAQAILLLRDAEQFKAHPVYVSTLIDMGALLLSSRAPGASEVDEGRSLLTEAWEIAKGLDARTRWRIARDLGLASVLAGDMAEAEKWYSTATELVPDDKVSKERLTTLRSVKNWK